MIKQWIFTIGFCLLIPMIWAQKPEIYTIKDTIQLNFEPQELAIHPQGFCLSDADGNLFLVDSAGQTIQNFSQNQQSEITHFESNNRLTNFVFYEELQKIITLNRFFAPIQTLSFENLNMGYILSATPSADRQIWLLDNSNLSIKKLNVFTQEITEIFSLDLMFDDSEFDVLLMKEYQNLLFICEQNQGIFVFDNLGNHKKTIPFKAVTSLHFYKNKLYVSSKNKIIFYDFYLDKKTELNIDYQGIIKNIIFKNDQIYAVFGNQILRFSK